MSIEARIKAAERAVAAEAEARKVSAGQWLSLAVAALDDETIEIPSFGEVQPSRKEAKHWPAFVQWAASLPDEPQPAAEAATER